MTLHKCAHIYKTATLVACFAMIPIANQAAVAFIGEFRSKLNQ